MRKKIHTLTVKYLISWRTLTFNVLTLIFLITTPGVSLASTGSSSLKIVNIGDSYASGEGILPITNPQCNQSHDNYARQIATSLHALLTDVSCSGAKIENLETPQKGPNGQIINEAQYKALTGDNDVVLVSIGGSDVDFIAAAIACASQQIVFPNCELTRTTTENQLPELQNKLNTVYSHIRSLEPHAQIFAIGYGRPLSSTMCIQAPLNAQNTEWVTHIIDTLSTYMKNSVTAIHGDYIDAAALSLGHNICSQQPWYVGMIPQTIGDGTPGHPRKIWHQAIASSIVQAIHINQEDKSRSTH